ncbi:ATP-binding protein [Acidisoma sp. S159]|uniref:ATP-binding protein n=1 Tax=Acidisoma sp. S159 TaxID=1747225 RepID=UPI00131CAB64|nr:ATP-binding protein [Acidisoma sp. S159]
MLPLLLFGGLAASFSAEHTRAATRALARDKAEQVAARISTELAAQITLAQALAVSTALDDGDFSTFRVETERLKALHPLWREIDLLTPAGGKPLHVAADVAPSLGDRESFRRAVRSQRPTIGGMASIGAPSLNPVVALRVPVMRQGTLDYILSVAMAPDSIGVILNTAGAPRNWIGVVVDASGHILARTQAEKEQLGQLASFTPEGAVAQQSTDFHTDHTMEGLRVETVTRILPNTGGWTVTFGIPAIALQAPVRRALLVLAASCFASLLLSAVLAALVTWDMTQRRMDERTRAERALRVSEERRVMAIDAAQLGNWRWDVAADHFDGSERCRAMLEMEQSRAAASVEGWQAALAAVHPDDRSALDEAVQRCLTESGNLSTEFRIRSKDGSQRWIRAIGRILDGGNERSRSLQGILDDITGSKRAETDRRELLLRLTLAQEDERRRISRDLHDQVGQTVTGLSLGLKALERQGGGSLTSIRVLQELTAAISRDIHRVATDLRPSVLDDLGLRRALQALAANITETSDIRIDVQSRGEEGRLSAEIEIVIFRAVQEALTNILKHADARAVSVLLDCSTEHLRVIVEDDGVGFRADPKAERGHGRHLGLAGMRERLALVGGDLTIQSEDGIGTTLFIKVPNLRPQQEFPS